MENLLIELVVCFIATLSFAIIFHVPKKALVVGACMGSLSWFTYRILPNYDISFILATALAAFLSGVFAYFFARKLKIPATSFTIPAIIPLVPGRKAYYTMVAFVDKEYLLGLELGTETLLQAGAIAAGLMFALSIFSFRKGGIGSRYEASR